MNTAPITTSLTKITKRSNKNVPFKPEKIARAIEKALRASGEGSKNTHVKITKSVLRSLELIKKENPDYIPTVEGVQDMIEKELMLNEFHETAKRYILYREQHAQIRRIVNTETVDLVDSYLDRADWQV